MKANITWIKGFRKLLGLTIFCGFLHKVAIGFQKLSKMGTSGFSEFVTSLAAFSKNSGNRKRFHSSDLKNIFLNISGTIQ
jgi:hypothetical protein